MLRTRYFLLIITILLSSPLAAKPLSPEHVPQPLKPWINWVLHDNENYRCPFLYNNFQQKRCAWPSRLNINLHNNYGEFSMDWKIYAKSRIQLPGNDRFWPLNVTVNNRPLPVITSGGRPVIYLAPGNYRIKGEFLWDYLPENLTVPDDTGLINLTVNGAEIPFPYIKKGQLWLKSSESRQDSTKSGHNKLDLQVFRRIIDDAPLQVQTRLELDVSGDQREVKISQPLLRGFIPMQLQSPLPARIEPDGSLLLQIRPGRWSIDLFARYPQEVRKLTLHNKDNNWPETEIWVFDARPHLRLVEIENITAIDPRQTNLPKQWRGMPAYQVKNGQSMVFKVIRRGDPLPEPDKLDLQRNLWLDFDGQGYTVNDIISGTVSRGWRLNVLPEMQLGLVSLDGRNQVITRLQETRQLGVEVRKGVINLSADSRLTGPVDLISATGWLQTFHSVKATLNLPPGWRLLAASGIDNVSQSWISRWTLLDLFLVLISALAVSRLWNMPWGLFALLMLAIIWHEPGAPRFVWLNILAAVALLRVLPEGRFTNFVKIYRNLSWLVLLIIAIPFMVTQVRIGIYPQLEKPWQSVSSRNYQASVTNALRNVARAPMDMEEKLTAKRRPRTKTRSPALDIDENRSSAAQSVNFNRIDPNANVQTGPGLPQWHWQKIALSWNGPVDEKQQMNFWLLPPFITMLLNFCRVFMVVVLALLMFGLLNKKINCKFPNFFNCLIIAAALMLQPNDSYADFPDQKMLRELRHRLLEAPECVPSCAQISTMKISIDDQSLVIALNVQSAQTVAFPLPANSKQWLPSRVLVDKQNAEGLFRGQKGGLWLTVETGNHTVEMRGRPPLLQKFSLPLPLKPHRVLVENQRWLVEGLHEHGIADGQLQFSRINKEIISQENKEILQPSVLPPFVNIERTLQLGVDWRVSNRIRRISPPGAAVILKVPLLPGESVITQGIRVENGKVLVNMQAGQMQMNWQSILEKNQQIEFTAEKTNAWTELWRADISPIWHMRTAGVSVIHHQDKLGRWMPEWRPWPGEKVTLQISRPEAEPGQTLTVDYTRLQVTPGQRIKEVSLQMIIRSSQGTQHTIFLPDDAELQSVTINNKSQPIRQKGTRATLPVQPGKQEFKLVWRQTSAISGFFTTPKVNIGADSVNSNLNINLGKERWVLFTFGPAIGPAVLFWGLLIIIAFLSVGLGRVPLTPLKHWQWLLLLTGLSQIPIAYAMIVIAWLMLLGLRAKNPLQQAGYFNAGQLALGLLTLAALVLLFVAVEQGLLGPPEMQITGNQSSAHRLNWYQDRSDAVLPTAMVISLPLMVYRLLMLGWSLWLAVSLLNWLKWGWECFSHDGLWKKNAPKNNNPLQMQQQDNG